MFRLRENLFHVSDSVCFPGDTGDSVDAVLKGVRVWKHVKSYIVELGKSDTELTNLGMWK